MNSTDVIVNISSMKDIDNITKDTKYINLSIDNVDVKVCDYFILNGKDFSYSDAINNRNGFIYASYDMFKYGEECIDNIIYNMPSNLKLIEKVRYIYVSLGKLLSIDINTMSDKNDNISFEMLSTINNIWGAISKGMVNDSVISKIFMYVCSRVGIKTELISSSIKGNIANKVYTDDGFLVVDLFNDIHNIQGGFITHYFDKYNDNKEIDKKIGYVKDEYTDCYIDNVLKDVIYNNDDTLFDVLSLTSNIINVSNIGTYELYKIYKNIFDKYVPNYGVKINNLFVLNNTDRRHFALFSYNNKYYSFNYSKGRFVNIDFNILYNNIESSTIGIYDGEEFSLSESKVML